MGTSLKRVLEQMEGSVDVPPAIVADAKAAMEKLYTAVTSVAAQARINEAERVAEAARSAQRPRSAD
eukprot:5160539-Alexandrium_andersonii.AAC.1